jgi:hypothetical protein
MRETTTVVVYGQSNEFNTNLSLELKEKIPTHALIEKLHIVKNSDEVLKLLAYRGKFIVITDNFSDVQLFVKNAGAKNQKIKFILYADRQTKINEKYLYACYIKRSIQTFQYLLGKINQYCKNNPFLEWDAEIGVGYVHFYDGTVSRGCTNSTDFYLCVERQGGMTGIERVATVQMVKERVKKYKIPSDEVVFDSPVNGFKDEDDDED